MIKHGVALVRLSTSPSGCTALELEEFYVCIVEGHILPTRFMSYASAFKHLERLWSDVA